MNSTLERAKDLAGRFTTTQKVVMGLAAAAVVVAVFTVTRLAGGGDGATAALYTGLSAADAASVTEQLATQGVAYELADGGSTVLVPQSELYAVRLDMAAQGLPRGGDGYALLDEQGLTTSEFAREVGYQRALEGELARTISSMDAVESATVHLVIPANDVFATEREQASASVMVRGRAADGLAGEQVDAVVHLVASSVRNLDAEDVTVTDASGALLAAPGIDGSTATGMDSNARQRDDYEARVARTITQLVEPVVGPGNARVSVTADLDFGQRTITNERFEQPSGDPEAPTPQTQAEREETYTGPGAGAVGVLGPDGEPLGGDVPTDYQLDEGETTFALNRTVESVQAAPGTVRQLGVAVAINDDVATPAVIAELDDLVGAGALIDADRGDTLEVLGVPFDTAAEDARLAELEAAEGAEDRRQMVELAQRAGLVLLLVAVVAFVWRTMWKASKRSAALPAGPPVREIEARPVPARAPNPVEIGDRTRELALADDLTDRRLAISDAALDDRGTGMLLDDLPGVDPAEEYKDVVTDEVVDMIDRQPDDVSQVLRSWLGDRRTAKR